MKEVSIIGHYGFGLNCLDGQTVKAKVLTSELVKKYGDCNVQSFDTHGQKLVALIKAPFQCLRALSTSKNVLILPAHNGLRVFVPLLILLNKVFKRKLHYVVIGGWLPTYLDTYKSLINKLKLFDGIYVETTNMKQALIEKGFNNIFVLPNCKELNILSSINLTYQEPYRLCTFSRVMKEKGIEDAINAVKEVNNMFGRKVFSLDIYGQIEKGQEDWFKGLKKDFGDETYYGGLVPFDKSVETLQNYFALLFPTKFYTEGIPGTIIDAYAAGLPVVASRWDNFNDVIEDGVSGIGFEFGNYQSLVEVLYDIVRKPDIILSKKHACLEKAKTYLPDSVITILLENF